MRKIQTKEIIDRNKKRNNIIIGVVLIGLMFFSILGYSFLGGDEGEESVVEYRGLKFFREGGMWKLPIEEQIFYFQYLPEEVENVSISGFYSLQNYADQPLYFVNLVSGEILNNLERYVPRWQEACLNDSSDCEDDLPSKTCEDNLIIFSEENNTAVWQEDSCVYISGDFSRASDAFLYKLFGIF